jgi:hypothetical protein
MQMQRGISGYNEEYEGELRKEHEGEWRREAM